MPDLRSTHWLKSNLAALGSAAVLTVYAAGWARTKSAADLLDEQSERLLPPRRPPARATMGQVEGTPTARAAQVAAQQTAEPPTAEPPVAQQTIAEQPVASRSKAEPASVPAATQKAAPVSPAKATVATTSAPSIPTSTPARTAVSGSVPPVAPTAAAQTVAAMTPAPATTVPTAPVPAAPVQDPNVVPGAPRELATNAQATAPAAKSADAPAGPLTYRDGLYSGWGMSRHGDIEAYVEIKGGRIKSTFIGECLTQYSCSWIAKLPPQVVEYQGSDIDYISGATHSSNAFYYAVVNALKKAAAR